MECREYRTKDHPIPGFRQMGEWLFDRCPFSYVTENVDYWLTAYQMYKAGFLPHGQQWIKEPNKLIEVIKFIDLQMAQHQKEVQEKNAKRQYSRNNHNTG